MFFAWICAMSCSSTAYAAKAWPARSLGDVLEQTAAVIEASVEDVQFRYDEIEGPRTVATLGRILVRLGRAIPEDLSTLEIRSFGGLLPDGREIAATDVPRLGLGERYVVFLRNTDWTLSPVAFGLALRVVTFGNTEALVDQSGRLVIGVSSYGVVRGPAAFARSEGFDPTRPESFDPDVTEADFERAMDPEELAGALVAFVQATARGPSGSFSMAPTRPSAFAWWRVETSRDTSGPVETGGDDLLACFAPTTETQDATPNDAGVCVDDGGGS